MKSYVGVTGFMNLSEVTSALSVFPRSSTRQLMVGVLVSWKSLRGIRLKPRWRKQFPNPHSISDLFIRDSRILNLVHYSTEEGEESSILKDLLKIHQYAGLDFHGFQINIPWPEIRLMDEYRMAMGCDYRLILQIGQEAMEMVDRSPQKVVEMLCRYVGIIDGILLDPSGGLGRQFNPTRARELLTAIIDQGWDLKLGVAGGLGPDSLYLVESLISEFPGLIIDAQGRLRNSKHNLDPEAVKTYLTRSLEMFDLEAVRMHLIKTLKMFD